MEMRTASLIVLVLFLAHRVEAQKGGAKGAMRKGGKGGGGARGGGGGGRDREQEEDSQ